METKPAKLTAAFMPRTMGVFVLLIIALSFAAGAIRREMILTLTGSVFLAVWIYCLAMTLLLAVIHLRRAARISIRLSPEKIITGEQTQVIFPEENDAVYNKNFLQFPGILVRFRVLLCTKDGRRVTHEFFPEKKSGCIRTQAFTVKKRGAYFAPNDELAVFDILGFFLFTYRIPVSISAETSGARLLVSPVAAGEPVPILAKGGESKRQDNPPIERTDELIDHRPYVPGDDPRRINWKLYSHGGGLFIRQGEREPPPHSCITILIDAQFDSFYTTKSARAAVDLLCENALAIINRTGKDRNIQIGFTGQTVKYGGLLTTAELGFHLAFPWAQSSALDQADLPDAPDNSAIVILALPRRLTRQSSPQSSALDRFLSKNINRSIELVFIYNAQENERGAFKERAAAAEMNAAFYNRRSGISVSVIAGDKTGIRQWEK